MWDWDLGLGQCITVFAIRPEPLFIFEHFEQACTLGMLRVLQARMLWKNLVDKDGTDVKFSPLDQTSEKLWCSEAEMADKSRQTWKRWMGKQSAQLRKTEYGIMNLNQAIKPWSAPKLCTAWLIQHLLRAGRAKEIWANQCHNICPLCSWRNGGIDRCCHVFSWHNKDFQIKDVVDSTWLKLELDQKWQRPCKLWACVCVWHLWSGGLKTQDMNGRVGRCLDWYPLRILVYHCQAWFSWSLHSLHFEGIIRDFDPSTSRYKALG